MTPDYVETYIRAQWWLFTHTSWIPIFVAIVILAINAYLDQTDYENREQKSDITKLGL